MARRWSNAARADAFADAVDGRAGVDNVDARTGRLVALTEQVRALPTAPLPTGRLAARAAIVSAAAITAGELARTAGHATSTAVTSTAATSTAATATGAGTGFLATTGAGHLLLPVVSGVLAVSVAGTGVGLAAHRAVPGQLFYGLKRGVEQVQLDFARGESAKARERLGFVAARVHEFGELAGPNPSSSTVGRMTGLLADIRGDMAAASGPLLGGGPADQRRLQQAAQDTAAALLAWRSTLPAGLRSSLDRTVSSLNATEQRAQMALGNVPGLGGAPGGGHLPLPSRSPGGGSASTRASTGPTGVRPAPSAAPTAAPRRPSQAPAPVPPHTRPIPVPPRVSPPGVLPSKILPSKIAPTKIIPSGVLPSIPLPLPSIVGGLPAHSG